MSEKKSKRKKAKQTGVEVSLPVADGVQRKPKLQREEYERELKRLQVELVKLQAWVKHVGARIVVVFEGRDAAGKGGLIKRITERVSPRVFRIVALPAPSDREKSQLYAQRYIPHMPAAGEVILFDRSWYNRAGVEKVLGFCTAKQHKGFLQTCHSWEEALINDGIVLLKYWLCVSQDEQERRFCARIEDPLRQWKLSPTDLESVRQWYEYSMARDAMLTATDTDLAPWYILMSDDKRRARLNCIRHLLSCVPYDDVPHGKVDIPKPDLTHQYDDVAALASRRFVPGHY